MTDVPLSILAGALSYEERAIKQIEAHIKAEKELLSQHKKSFKNIRKRLGLAPTAGHKKGKSRINKNLGIEWYTLEKVIQSGVDLRDYSEWHFRGGAGDRCQPLISVQFVFPVKKDPVMRRMIKQLAPTIELSKSCNEAICSDVYSTVTMSRLLITPITVTYLRELPGGGFRHACSNKPLTVRIARYLDGGGHGREDADE